MFAKPVPGPAQAKPKTDSSALVGKTLAIDTVKLLTILSTMQTAGVKYDYGSRCPLSKKLADIKKIDCSAFVRYAVYHASSMQVKMADGSSLQDDWCKKQGLAVVSYKDTAGSMDHRLRIAFLHGAKGHVWLVLDGQTLESHSHVGPGRRVWSTPILLQNVSKCYLMT